MNHIKRRGWREALAAGALLAACSAAAAAPASARPGGDLTAENHRATAEALMPLVLGGEAAASLLQRTLFETASQGGASGAVACAGGGTLLLDKTALARPGRPTPGDVLQVTARNCSDKGPPLTGRLQMVVLAVQESAVRAYVRMSLKALAFGSAQQRLNGTSIFEFDERASGRRTLAVRFQGLTLRTPKQTATLEHGYRYVREGGVSRVSALGLVRAEGKSYELKQRTPFERAAAGAGLQKGLLELVDRDGDRVEVRFAGRRTAYAWLPAGGGTPGKTPAKEAAKEAADKGRTAKEAEAAKGTTKAALPKKAAAPKDAAPKTGAPKETAAKAMTQAAPVKKEPAARGPARAADL